MTTVNTTSPGSSPDVMPKPTPITTPDLVMSDSIIVHTPYAPVQGHFRPAPMTYSRADLLNVWVTSDDELVKLSEAHGLPRPSGLRNRGKILQRLQGLQLHDTTVMWRKRLAKILRIKVVPSDTNAIILTKLNRRLAFQPSTAIKPVKLETALPTGSVTTEFTPKLHACGDKAADEILPSVMRSGGTDELMNQPETAVPPRDDVQGLSPSPESAVLLVIHVEPSKPMSATVDREFNCPIDILQHSQPPFSHRNSPGEDFEDDSICSDSHSIRSDSDNGSGQDSISAGKQSDPVYFLCGANVYPPRPRHDADCCVRVANCETKMLNRIAELERDNERLSDLCTAQEQLITRFMTQFENVVDDLGELGRRMNHQPEAPDHFTAVCDPGSEANSHKGRCKSEDSLHSTLSPPAAARAKPKLHLDTDNLVHCVSQPQLTETRVAPLPAWGRLKQDCERTLEDMMADLDFVL